MALNQILFNVGLNIDGSQAQVDMTEALEQLSKAAQKYGIDIPVNCTSLEDLTAQLQAMGLQINVTQDAVTGMLNGIAVSGRNINGQFVQLNQTIA